MPSRTKQKKIEAEGHLRTLRWLRSAWSIDRKHDVVHGPGIEVRHRGDSVSSGKGELACKLIDGP